MDDDHAEGVAEEKRAKEAIEQAIAQMDFHNPRYEYAVVAFDMLGLGKSDTSD